jgi:hypothetical protein
MHKYLTIVLMLCSSVLLGHAQAAIPTIRILPEEVVQDSVHQHYMGGDTNNVMVRWQYTEAGAKKMWDFWNAHGGQKVLIRVGDFESRATIMLRKPFPPPAGGDDEGWLKTRTDKFFGISEANAKLLIAGLKGK